MESFGAYRAAGINMALGTDTNPQSVIEAMRWAAVVAKMMERQTESTTAAHVFDASRDRVPCQWPESADWAPSVPRRRVARSLPAESRGRS